MSSACTSRKRSPTLIASRSRRLCRSATSWTIFSSSALADVRRSRSAGAIGGDAPPRPLDRDLEARLIDRLQQVVDRVDLERLDRVLIVRGDEDDVRRGAGRRPAAAPPRSRSGPASARRGTRRRAAAARSSSAPRRRCRPGRSRRRRRSGRADSRARRAPAARRRPRRSPSGASPVRQVTRHAVTRSGTPVRESRR